MIDKDLDNKLVNVFKDCPYGGQRDNCAFSAMQEMEIAEKLDYFSDREKYQGSEIFMISISPFYPQFQTFHK